jgi:hypothetical protein
MEQRDERIIIETARHRISGLLSLPRDGYRSRLTDYLNAGERAFLALTEVEVAPLDGGGPGESGGWVPYHRPFMALAISQIVFAMPFDPDGSIEA